MRTLIASAVLFLALGFPRDANACSCVQSGPPCQDFFQADAVFVGTVLEITPIEGSGHHAQSRNQRVRLVVDRALRGVNGKAVELMTEPSGGQCGYPFRAGGKYVVYAYRYKGDAQLWASICSRTHAVGEADEDLRYFDRLPAKSTGGRVYGAVNNPFRLLSKNPVIYEPVESVPIVLQGPAGTFTTSSDHEGEYEFTGLPSGKYVIKVTPPAPFSRRYLEGTIQLRAPGCVEANYLLRYDNRISGSLATPDGVPASDVEVQLRQAEAAASTRVGGWHDRAKTDARGHFEFPDVSPGRYIVGVGLTRTLLQDTIYPATFYPGTRTATDASIIEIGEGTRVELQPFRVPPALKAVTLSGIVSWPDEAPAVGVQVSLQNGDPSVPRDGFGTKSDSEGRFSYRIHEGLRYIVGSWHSIGEGSERRQFDAETAPFTGSAGSDPLRLVLKPKRQ